MKLLLFLLSVACILSDHSKAEGSTQVEKGVELLSKAPAWADMSSEAIHQNGKVLMKTFSELAKMDHETVKAVVSRFVAEYPMEKFGVGPVSKVYVFNRYYFLVRGLTDSRINGGWLRNKEDPPLLTWPLVEGADGSIELKYALFAYTGPVYRAMDEFKYFESVFAIRGSGTRKLDITPLQK